MSDKTKKRSACPLSCSLDIWGDKWSLLILRDMIVDKKSTYSEFLKSPEKIATNILASRLQQLEKEGLLGKQEHPDSKAKVLYKLSRKGLSMLPVLIEMYLWADANMNLSAEYIAKINAIKANKEAFIQSVYQDAGEWQ